MGKITKRVVDALKPVSGKDLFVWDSELRGFGVRMKPSGAAAFLIQYRNEHGRTRRMVVGKVGTLTPVQARSVAREKLVSVARGEDPSANRQTTRQALTAADICDWYLQEGGAGRLIGRRGAPIKKSTLTMDRSRIEQHVKPLIGDEPVAGLTVPKLERMQAQIAAGRTKQNKRAGRGGNTKGGAAVAGRTLGMLHAVFEHAKRAQLIDENPVRGARKIAARKRTTRLSMDQLSALGEALRHEGENPTGVAAIRLIAMTGFRRQEALGIRKAWLMPSGGVTFPDTKSGPQVRPAGAAAMALLREQTALSETEWVFPAERGEGHFVGIRKVLGRVAMRAGLECTPHVLRHTFSSIAADLGYSELVIAGLLGHAARGVTQGYVHLDQSLVAAANRVAGVISGALEGQQRAAILEFEAVGKHGPN